MKKKLFFVLTLVFILSAFPIHANSEEKLDYTTTEYELNGKKWVQPMIVNTSGKNLDGFLIKIKFTSKPDEIVEDPKLADKLYGIENLSLFSDDNGLIYYMYVEGFEPKGIVVGENFGFLSSDVDAEIFAKEVVLPKDFGSEEANKIYDSTNKKVFEIQGVGPQAILENAKNTKRAQNGDKTVIKKLVDENSENILIESKKESDSKEGSKTENSDKKTADNSNSQPEKSEKFIVLPDGTKKEVKTSNGISYIEDEKNVDDLTPEDLAENEEVENMLTQEKDEVSPQEKLNKTNSKEALESSETDSQNNSKTQLDSTSNNNSSNLIYIVIGLVILGVLAGGGFLIWKQRQ